MRRHGSIRGRRLSIHASGVFASGMPPHGLRRTRARRGMCSRRCWGLGVVVRCPAGAPPRGHMTKGGATATEVVGHASTIEVHRFRRAAHQPWACPRDTTTGRGCSRHPRTRPAPASGGARANDRTLGGFTRALARWALASACENRKSSLRRHQGAISTQGGTCNTTQRRIAVARRATSRRQTKSPRRQRSHPQPRHRVSLPNAPSNSAAAATSANPDAAGRVASHPHPTARPPAPPLGTARGRSCRRVDEGTGKQNVTEC